MARRSPRPPPPPGFLFFGCFSGRRDVLGEARRLIVRKYGPLHPRGESEVFPFPETESYRDSMGSGLLRQFFVIERRWPQEGLASVKRDALAMEDRIRERWGPETGLDRPVNIDPGLINDCRIILATTKDYAHRIYRGDGIWEEVTLIYRQGRYEALPWTYRDFRNPGYHRFFELFRTEFIEERNRRPSPG